MNTLKYLLGALLCVSACGDTPADAPVPAGAVQAEQAPLRPGDIHRYAFSWTVESEGTNGMLGEVAVRGDVELTGELAAEVYERNAEGAWVGVRFARLDTHRVGILGQNVLPSADPLLQSEALVFVPTGAQPRDVRFDPESPSVFRKLMSGILAHVDLAIPSSAGPSWQTVGPTGNGLARLQYDRDPQTGRIHRTLDEYVRVDAFSHADHTAPWEVNSQADIDVGREALVDAIELSESLVLHAVETPASFGSKTEFSLRRMGIDHQDPRTLPSLEDWTSVDLFEAPDTAEAEREMARKFAEGLTTTDLVIAVQSAGRGLRPWPGFQVRARGLLRGWPETARELGPLFAEAEDLRTRGFIADLLISADTVESQEVLLDALADLDGEAATDLPDLLQHLVLLRTPTTATARFVLDQYERAVADGDARTRRACLYPMGALAGQFTGTDPELSERLVVAVRRDLEQAVDPDDITAGLAGLGNAAREEDTERLLAYRYHPDQGVRAQVASSVRFSRSPEARAAVLEMLGDYERFVAASALGVVDGYLRDDAALHELAARTIDGDVNPQLNGPLIGVLAKRGLDDERAQEALFALMERTDNPREHVRIRRILGVGA